MVTQCTVVMYGTRTCICCGNFDISTNTVFEHRSANKCTLYTVHVHVKPFVIQFMMHVRVRVHWSVAMALCR